MSVLYRDVSLFSVTSVRNIPVSHEFRTVPLEERSNIKQWKLFPQKFISVRLITWSGERSLCTFGSGSFWLGKIWTTGPRVSPNIDRSSFYRRFHVTWGPAWFLASSNISFFVFVLFLPLWFHSGSFVDSLKNFLFVFEHIFLWSSLCRAYFLVLSPYYCSVLLTAWLGDVFYPPCLFSYGASCIIVIGSSLWNLPCLFKYSSPSVSYSPH